MLVLTNQDYICLIIGVIGTILCVYQLHECGWDLEKLLFEEEE